MREALATAAPPRSGWACALPLLAVVAVLWMATRPYRGVVHDGRLYALQALSAADPVRFADDLFLRFGSQDRFTVFSRLYGPVLDWAGVSWGALLLTVLAHAAWLGGAYVLARALLRDPIRALAAVAGLVALPSAYGAEFSFSYGEPFLTPRLLAEALAMAALGRALAGSTVLAAASLALAGAVHPVMAIPGAAAFLLYKALGNRAWWIVAVGAVAAGGGLAAAGIEPFSRFGARLDPAWLAIVRERASYAFIGQWSATDLGILAGHAALATLALLASGPDHRRFFLAVLLTAAGGLGMAFVGGDLAADQLLTALQTWRATWLLAVVAHLMAVPLLLRFRGRGAGTLQPTCALLLGGVALLVLARLVAAAHVWAAAALGLAVVSALGRRNGKPLTPVVRVLAAAAAAAIAVHVLRLALAAKAELQLWPEEFWLRLWASGVSVAGLALAVAVALRARPSPTGGAASNPVPALCAACMLFCAALGWDQRTAWTAFVESSDAVPAELAGFVPSDVTVYWEGGLELLWLRLKRPSYFSCAQAAGVMFFRGTAMAYAHRSESLGRCGRPAAEHEARTTRAELQRACAREPELDWIVLPRLVEDVPRREWVSPVKLPELRITNGRLHIREHDRFHAYPCDALR